MIDSVLNEYAISSEWQSTDLGNANGFSGSNIWRIESKALGTLCLKRWPEGFSDTERIQWIHRVLHFVHANGCPEVALPLKAGSGDTYIVNNGTVWELFCWATGAPGIDDAPVERVNAAIETLARFHQATARFHMNFTPSKNLQIICNQLFDLRDRLQKINAQFNNKMAVVVAAEDWKRFASTASAIALDIARFLLPYSRATLPVQPVIRDVRPEHFFFEDSKVTNLIDFGAMRIDSIACDLARILGGFFGDEATKFQQAIQHYGSLRQLSHVETEIILPINHANLVLSIANWMSWLYVERVQFDSMEQVAARVQKLFRRYNALVH